MRTIAMGSSEGVSRGLGVTNTGKPIAVPVGQGTLGRIMDVLGNPIDEGGPVAHDDTRIADPPRAAEPYADQYSVGGAARNRHQGHRPDHAPSPRAARSACSAVPAWARP
ncbi:MAG: hypothetical protein MPW14_10325 [Candidatus Manganitrophus sp.]|nr:MAG: hypothetical protein MPW14_10325 [Candidatus Manganitrophus sp.]